MDDDVVVVLRVSDGILELVIEAISVPITRCVIIERVASDATLLFIHIRASIESNANKMT